MLPLHFLHFFSKNFDLGKLKSLPFEEVESRIVQSISLLAETSSSETFIDALCLVSACGCSSAYSRYARPYSGPVSSLITAGLFELAIHDWELTEQDLGSLSMTRLFQIIGSQNKIVTQKIFSIERSANGQLSITAMFDLQLKTEHLCQVTEMSTSLTTALTGCLQNIARNAK